MSQNLKEQFFNVHHQLVEAVDPEILGIFLEEATVILERWDTLLNTWRDDLSDLTIVQNLQREIHTFKGGEIPILSLSISRMFTSGFSDNPCSVNPVPASNEETP